MDHFKNFDRIACVGFASADRDFQDEEAYSAS
jgi:hypothetical protein